MSALQQLMLGTSGALQFDITIAADTTNYDLLAILIAAPHNYNNTSPANITLTINSAVQVSSTSTGTPALTTGAITSNAVLYIINTGSIKGKGGAGGAGGSVNYPSSTNPGSSGNQGGVALNIASTLSGKVTITNGSGEIFGGGGGGGGGGCALFQGGGKDNGWAIGGAGGGGGAGTGAGALGGVATGEDVNYNGLPGSSGTTSAGGAGGAQFCGNQCNGAGGAGGGFGAVGVVGGNGYSEDGGAAGGAGNAIALNGGSSPTFISGNDGTHVKGAVS